MQCASSTQMKEMGGKVESFLRKFGETNFSGEMKTIWSSEKFHGKSIHHLDATVTDLSLDRVGF